MKLKQIFAEYSYSGNDGIGHLKYCPSCGTACEIKNEGDRQRSVCPKCGFVNYRNPSPAVSVLIHDDSKVLLGKRAGWNFQGEKWCLPCGFIEFDEDYLTAGRREVKEETGLDVEIDGIINVTHNFFHPGLHTLVVVLAAHRIGGELTPNDDIVEVRWCDANQELPNLAFAADRMLITCFFEKHLPMIPVTLS